MKTTATLPAGDLERRKKVRLRLRTDLGIARHKYEGKAYYIVKDPVSLRYYRFKEQEHFLLKLMDGKHSLADAQKQFEKRFRPERLKLEDLESFAQQLLTVGLAHNESPQAGKQLYDRRNKRVRREWMAYFTNILYIKIPVFDPDRLLTKMLPFLRWVFTAWAFAGSISLMLAAIMLVATHFETFRDKLPSYHEFFQFQTVVYLWAALGVVKVIHEFGHGLSCKAFGGEVHEMGFLFLCLSPAMYCNVSDAWTMPNKWHRMIISFAGIYVELVIASLATFIWWNTPSHPFINNLSLSLMVVCSVSTVLFNGNPLMRYDGYYVLADWIEIPNLRDRCNRFLRQIFLEHCLGVEVHREAYMALGRRILFVVYAVVSYVYKWVVTFGVLYFMYMFLRPYKLGAVSALLAAASLGSMIGWPLWQFSQNYLKRGRLPDMKPVRVSITSGVAAVLLLIFFFVPLPVSRVRQTAVVQVEPLAVEKVFVPSSNVILKKLMATNGQMVQKNDKIAVFSSSEIDEQLEETNGMVEILKKSLASLQQSRDSINDPSEKGKLERDIADRKEKLDINQRRWLYYRDQHEKLEVLAPRTGMVYGLPQVEEIGKTWEQDQQKPFCSVGDPDRLEVLVPVVPADYHLLGEDLNDLFRRGYKSGLSVTIRVQGRGGQTWTGRVTDLPQSDAKEVPAALTAKHGGPLAVKPGTNPNVFVPQSQNYLVAVAFDRPDRAICPGTLAQVKIHCRWHSCAWWAWRTISQTFDLGLI